MAGPRIPLKDRIRLDIFENVEKEQIAEMYEKVTEVLKRQYTYFETVNLFYNGN